MVILRDYQSKIRKQATQILKNKKICFLCMECRTGKTLVSLSIADSYGAKSVLFVTKKLAIKSVESDYANLKPKFAIEIVNYEQVHKCKGKYDFVIIDESHNLGAYPKPSLRTVRIKTKVGDKPLLLLSATPSPESYSQLYHQFWLSNYSPFAACGTFYKWANAGYVEIGRQKRGGMFFNTYDKANETKVFNAIEPYLIHFTQQEAGFKQVLKEEVEYVPIDTRITKLVKKLLLNKIYTFKDGTSIVCDTAVKLQSKVHQICSGTVILDDGNVKILNTVKAQYIAEKYHDKRIAVFYKYKGEYEAITQELTNYTSEPEAFNSGSYSVFIGQIKSASQGVNLSTADYLIFYNIDFSATSYFQARERLQSKDRAKPALIKWLFTKGGIEEDIFKVVSNKKQYTNKYFIKYTEKI